MKTKHHQDPIYCRINRIRIHRYLLIIFLIISIQSMGQVARFRAVDWSLKEDLTKDWPAGRSSDAIIVFNNDLLQINIFSEPELRFDILTSDGPYIDKDGDHYRNFTCIDTEGHKCQVILYKRIANDSWQIYIEYSDLHVCYNAFELN